MMLYLTGAQTSLAKSPEAPQTDPSKSLGGYVSSTPVPNGEVNALFDLISSFTLDKRQRETIAIGLINTLPGSVSDVRLKIVKGREDIASFRVAAVALSDANAMEQIPNRYAEPLAATFHNADFQRASVDFEVTSPATEGEEIAFMPFGIACEVEESGIEGTWKAFENAFSDDETFEMTRLSEKTFRLSRRDESVLDEPIECSVIATKGFSAVFKGEFKNGVTNEVVLVEDGKELASGRGIGLWLQREFKKVQRPSNEQLVEDYKNKVFLPDYETIELVISYNLVERKNYNEKYNQEQYS